MNRFWRVGVEAQPTRTDWSPTLGIAVAGLTVYLVYTSLRLDRVIRSQGEARAAQSERDGRAAQDRQEIKDRAVSRTRRIGYALSLMSIVVVALTIKGVVN